MKNTSTKNTVTKSTSTKSTFIKNTTIKNSSLKNMTLGNALTRDTATKNSKTFLKPIILTDIDDTLTYQGKLHPDCYQALWDLHYAGFSVIPVTGRPAGWCDMIARLWPVTGVVGENGAFYFSYDHHHHTMIQKFFSQPHRENLNHIENEILKEVPQAKTSSDQFARLFDLAIDIKEDVEPLTEHDIQKILTIFKNHGAQAKISSIHINGWFGHSNKVTGSLEILKDLFKLTPEEAFRSVYFIGDSPNDEPMWEVFQNSFAVGNIRNYLPKLKYHPKTIMNADGGKGFVEFAKTLLKI
jgi:HAD superfamily hydrolase (TIGR01484 family)